VTSGRLFFSAEPPAPHLRLSFAGVSGAAELAEAVRRLADCGGLPGTETC
ncbi:PLP-dependent aminotransferase family protein, partial [Streptomyces sp. 12297]